MQNNHEGRESDHQDGGVQRAQAGDPALDASGPGNKHRDPGALDRERQRNEKYGSTGLVSKGHRLNSACGLNSEIALSPPNESSSPKDLQKLRTISGCHMPEPRHSIAGPGAQDGYSVGYKSL